MTATIHPIVVVGVAGSDASRLAVRWADHYAAETGGTLRLVTVWEHPPEYTGTAAVRYAFDLSKAAGDVTENARQDVTAPAERLQVRVIEGSPRLALTGAAADADLLVVGSKGHSGVETLLLGSVSAYCVDHSTVPVVVVR